MNVLSLFSGIGGLDLGLQRAGMTVVGQVEIDPWCRTILAKHWPEVPRHDDVRTAARWWLEDVADTEGDGRREGRPRGSAGGSQNGEGVTQPRLASRSSGRPAVDVVAGGFPCQPVSLAGKGLAQADSRWLWPPTRDVIRHLRPRYVLLENVPGLLGRGMGDVLGDLAACGYDAEWDCVPACFVGAPHIRNRVFVVAYPASAGSAAQHRQRAEPAAVWPPASPGARRGARGRIAHCREWPVEPGVGRVAHGIPRRVDRLRGLGNAVVPAVAEHVGRLIMEAAA